LAGGPQTAGLGINGYRLEIRPSVEKALRKILDAKLRRRLDAALIKLAENLRRMGAEKMAGFRNRYRFRVGDYRIIYEIQDAVLVVLVLAIGDRTEIYR
jgi:mRNA interferase RelE/StbE